METAQQASLVADAARNAHEQTMGYILHEVRHPSTHPVRRRRVRLCG